MHQTWIRRDSREAFCKKISVWICAVDLGHHTRDHTRSLSTLVTHRVHTHRRKKTPLVGCRDTQKNKRPQGARAPAQVGYDANSGKDHARRPPGHPQLLLRNGCARARGWLSPLALYSAIISTELSLVVYAGGGGITVGSELMVMAEARLTLPPRPAPFLSGASHLVGVRGTRRLGVGVGEVRVRVRVRIFPPRLAGGLVVELLPYISPISPLYLPYISPISPIYLPYISPISPYISMYLPISPTATPPRPRGRSRRRRPR